MKAHYLLIYLIAFSSIFSSELTFSETIFDRAVKIVSSLAGDKKEKERKKEDLTYKVSLPQDLPNHWRLNTMRESVFGGEILLAESGNTQNPTILLIHGLGSAGMRDWLNVVPTLEKEYHVVLIDLPGFASSKTPAGKYSPTNYAHVLAAVKMRVAPKKKIRVVGHSMGGAVTLRYAEHYPNHVSSVVVVDAAGILERTAFVKHSASLPDMLEYSPGKLNQIIHNTKDFGYNLIEVVNTFPDVTRFLVNDASWAKVFGNRANVNAAFALIKEDFSSALDKVTIPVGIIWGQKDGVAPLRTGKVLEHQLSNATLVVIPGAGHVPMKSHKEQFNTLLTQLLEKPEATPSWHQEIDELVCKNEQGKTYSGRYKRIVIEGCSDVTLLNVSANLIEAQNSRITLENVNLKSDDLAFDIKNSTVTATNLNIYSVRGIKTDSSRLDIAGANIVVDDSALISKDKSRVIFSVSRIDSAYVKSNVHGLFSLENEILDKVLK